MGLEFFSRSVELQDKYKKPGTRVENTFQTNGILLDDEWRRFFREKNFLIGLSIDGPKELHDIYRRDKGGLGTFGRVLRAARLLQKHKVEFNVGNVAALAVLVLVRTFRSRALLVEIEGRWPWQAKTQPEGKG
jgi:sulfatase maturation enzyme AslB (radical SAM superfamily)